MNYYYFFLKVELLQPKKIDFLNIYIIYFDQLVIIIEKNFFKPNNYPKMENIDDASSLYDYLKQTKLTIIKFSHINYDEIGYWPNIVDSVFHFEPNEAKKHSSKYSLLFEGQTDTVVEFEAGQPKQLVTYNIIFTVACSHNTPITYTAKENIEMDQTANFDECDFFIEYFICHPHFMTITNCHDNNCQRFSTNKTGFWCESCQGKFDYAYNLKEIMSKCLPFRCVPKKSVLHIQKFVKKIDWKNKDELIRLNRILTNNKKVIEGLKMNIDSTEEDIKSYISKRFVEKEKSIRGLYKILKEYGIDSIDNFNKIIGEINDKIHNFG